ncbi:hypothetical protein ACHAXM_009340 [Skeletonema potamos]
MILAKAFVFFQLFSSALSTDLSGKETRIIGGFQAEENRYPYSVSLQDRFSGHFCGGSLILKDVVLTAAHCLGGTFDVVIGRDDFNDSDGEIISTRWQIGHPGYNTDTDENDLALIVLSNPVQNVVPLITLNDDSSYPSAGTIAYVMGWGVTDTGNNDPLPQQMQMVDVQVISNQDCETLERGGESYGGYGFGVYGSNICTYTEKKDACQGDSGGPLIIRGNDASQDVLVGVVSWGIGCAYLPGVYGRVSQAYGWIQQTACEVSSDTSGSTLCGTEHPTQSPKPTESPTSSPSLRPTDKPSGSPSSPPSYSPTTSSQPSSKPTVSTSPTISSSPTLSSAPTTTAAKNTRDGLMISSLALVNSEGNVGSNSSNTFRSGVCIGSALSFVVTAWLMR